eukprot:5608180-Amphidinium_carterae.1
MSDGRPTIVELQDWHRTTVRQIKELEDFMTMACESGQNDPKTLEIAIGRASAALDARFGTLAKLQTLLSSGGSKQWQQHVQQHAVSARADLGETA